MSNYYKQTSAIILSGGKSKRMGQDKCNLTFNNNTFIDIQINKLKSIGIEDIILSGYRGTNENAIVLKDDIMKGPLSGMLIGFQNIKNDRAVVLSVDTPLISIDIIKFLIDVSFENDFDAVIPIHDGYKEKLIAVYKKRIINNIKYILDSDSYKVENLLSLINCHFVNIEDKNEYFFNVNNKKDYDKLLNNT